MSEAVRQLRLVTFLGTGNYEEVVYRDPASERCAPPTQWVARALAELYRPDEIIVLATPTAAAKHGPALLADLSAAGFSAKIHPIDEGGEPANLWQQFATIKEMLRAPANGSVILDITLGFRSQPFFAAAVIAFVRAVDAEPLPLRVVYGGYGAKDAAGVAPIWELTAFIDLLDWTREIMLFLKTGRVAGVAELAERRGRTLAKAWSQGDRDGPRPSLDALGCALEAFGRDLETVRTGALLLGDGSQPGSARRLIETIKRARGDLNEQVPPLADVLDRIAEMALPLAGCGDRLNHPGGHAALVALAELYVDMARYSEAATTVREGFVTLYANDQAACPGQKGFNDEQRREADRLWQIRDGGLGRDVARVRNDIDHGGYRAQPLPAKKVENQIRKLVDAFKKAEVKPASGCEPVFVNISNHPSDEWADAQRAAALALAPRIVDVPFPSVAPEATAEDVTALADRVAAAVPAAATHALVQGEFTLAFAVVRALQRRGIRCLAATTERAVTRTPAGEDIRRFGFVGFRSYLD
jgi:CRISPR-associated protein Csx16